MKKQRGSGFIDEIIIVAVAVLVVAAILGAVAGAMYWVRSKTCAARAERMGLQHDYGFWQGCMVRVGGRYAPINYIRIVDEKVVIQGEGGEE